MAISIKGKRRPGTSIDAGNVIQRIRSVPITAANLKSYPGNFKIKDMSANWTDLTTNGFTASKQTLWAKE